jgi:hypothetical protein
LFDELRNTPGSATPGKIVFKGSLKYRAMVSLVALMTRVMTQQFLLRLSR